MLAHCRGKQARNHEVAGGLTTPPWCLFVCLLGTLILDFRHTGSYVAIYMLLD